MLTLMGSVAGVYLWAFDSRFSTTCSTRKGSANTVADSIEVAEDDGAVRVLVAELLHHAAQYMVQRDRLEIHHEPAGLDQRDIEHVVHDSLQTAAPGAT